MAVKKVLMSKKIANTLYDIYPKTAADIVEYGNNSNVKAALDSIATDLSDIYTKSQVDALVEAVDGKLDTLIGEGEIDTAFDTIKEIADWLVSGDGSAVSGLISDVSDLKTTVGNSSAGLVKDVDDLQTAVGDANSGLVKDMADAQGDITALETAVGDANSGLVKDVADLQAVGATKVEASTSNGYIKIDNVETQVYDDSAIPAANIVESTTKQFVAATDVTNWNSAAHILSSSSGATENDLIITEIVEQQEQGGGGE